MKNIRSPHLVSTSACVTQLSTAKAETPADPAGTTIDTIRPRVDFFASASMKLCQYAIATVAILATPLYAGEARFSAPNNEAELKSRVTELQEAYAPYLRSLPAKLPEPTRTKLPTDWKFSFEETLSPKVPGIPPAPPWQGIGFDDSKWETTTVPEWRYRTHDADETALEPKKIAVWKKIGLPSDTICWYRTAFRAAPTVPEKRQWLCFDGVDWEAQVYLNGELLGTHRVYYEPFRFDVTGKLKEQNTLAVRVIAGPSYGQPVSFWGLFPDIRAAKQRYTPDRAQSIPGNLPIGYHSGSGYGIFRNVYLEQSGPVRIAAIFARNDLSSGIARVKVEFDGRPSEVNIELLPENFNGRSYTKKVRCESNALTVEIPMPDAKEWSQESPNLYRCRVTVAGSDARDALFGCRSFRLSKGRKDVADGMFLLNNRPAFLRGTNIHGLNLYSYWGQKDELMQALWLLKAGNFNTVRSCQHVEFPEVLELMDRVGLMSEQDQAGGRSINKLSEEQYVLTGTVLARQTYNNPGVVLLSFINEKDYPTEAIMRAALEVDPQRIFKPISGRFTGSKKPWSLPEDLRNIAVDDGHPYTSWYGHITAQSWNNLKFYELSRQVRLGGDYGTVMLPNRPVTLGEFGAEALDAYETMRDHYPPQFKPPGPKADTLWAAAQLGKHDVKQISGLGRNPRNLAEYIEASQNYQEAVLSDQIIGMRLSPGAISGYFQFHFLDVVPAFWPKSIVSHDHRPKKAYYQSAQVNQPVVALPQLTGARPDAMTLWIANDLPEPIPQAKLHWKLSQAGEVLLEGRQILDVPAAGAVSGDKLDLSAIVAKHASFDLVLTVDDATGKPISRFQRTVRVVPSKSQGQKAHVVDPFNQNKAK